MMRGCIEAPCSAFLVNFPVQTGSKFGMGGVRLALHEMKILVSCYLLPLLFVLLLLLFLSFTLVGDASHSFFEHRRYSINQVCHISTPAQDRTVCKP